MLKNDARSSQPNNADPSAATGNGRCVEAGVFCRRTLRVAYRTLSKWVPIVLAAACGCIARGGYYELPGDGQGSTGDVGHAAGDPMPAGDEAGDGQGSTDDTPPCVDAQTPERALWLWDPTVASDATKRAELIDFLYAKRMSEVMLESEAFVHGDQSTLTAIIGDLSARCIGVRLLFSNPDWSLTAYHAEAANLARLAAIFAAAASPAPRGLMFHVAPHVLAEWSSDLEGTANQFVDLLPLLTAETESRGVGLRVNLPFWYDGEAILRQAQTRPLSEWIMDEVGDISIMAYRDHADPPDGIVDSIAGEMAYAEGNNGSVIITVQTACGGQPEQVTFCEEGEAAMDTELSAVYAAYGASTAFRLLAIHDYAAFPLLPP